MTQHELCINIATVIEADFPYGGLPKKQKLKPTPSRTQSYQSLFFLFSPSLSSYLSPLFSLSPSLSLSLSLSLPLSLPLSLSLSLSPLSLPSLSHSLSQLDQLTNPQSVTGHQLGATFCFEPKALDTAEERGTEEEDKKMKVSPRIPLHTGGTTDKLCLGPR